MASMNNIYFTLLCMFVLVGVLVSAHPRSEPRPACPPNEEWSTCGSSCAKTCANPDPQICTLQCIVGCQCKTGFWKNNAGQCVLPSEC